MASEREARIEALPAKVQQWLRNHQGKTYRDNGATAAVIAYLTAPSFVPDYPAELATLKQLIESAHDGQTSSGEPTTHAAALREIIANARLANAPSAAPASAGRAVEELQRFHEWWRAEAEKDSYDAVDPDDIDTRLRDRIAALRAEPSPKPRRRCDHRSPGECDISCGGSVPAPDKRGLYGKFRIERADGRDARGEKHDGCDYFVLDLTHDKHAKAAIRAYAHDCREERPQLSRDLIAKVGAEPSPEPQRAGAGLVEAAKALLTVHDDAEDDDQHYVETGTIAWDDLREALAVEQAREPVRPDSDRIRDLKSRVEIEKQRAEKAESAFKQADAERQIAQDALRAYRKQVEALRGRAVALVAEKRETLSLCGATMNLVRDLAALPTEPDGAKADAGGVAVLPMDQVPEVRRGKFFGGEVFNRLLAEAESQPEGEAERPTCEVCTERPAVHVAAKAGHMLLCDDCHKAVVNRDDGEARDGDDVLREFLEWSEDGSQDGALDSGLLALVELVKRALEGR